MTEPVIEKWAENHPPVKSPKSGMTYLQAAQEMRDRQGRWALLLEGGTAERAKSLVRRINKGKNRAWQPAGDFEAVSRTREDGAVTVWARYCGDGNAAEAREYALWNMVESLKEDLHRYIDDSMEEAVAQHCNAQLGMLCALYKKLIEEKE